MTILLIYFLIQPIGLSALEGDNINVDDRNNTKIIDVPYINQNEIVYGCEAVSSTMLLRYYGYDINEKDFTDKYLIKRDWHYNKEDGQIYGPDPNAAYPGNPYIDSGINCGFGCYAHATSKSIQKVLDNGYIAKVTTGLNLKDLIDNYINNDDPVLVWATMDMEPSYLTISWIIDYVDQNSPYKIGDTFTWLAGEHCLILVGYDEYNYYFNDPYKDHGLIGYEKRLVEQRFMEMGKQSIVIIK